MTTTLHARTDKNLPVQSWGTQLAKEPYWIDQTGNQHIIEDMGSNHMFFCLTMLWNNSSAVKTRENYQRWDLRADRFHNRNYLRSVISTMWKELQRRKDLRPYQYQELNTMLAYWNTLADIKELE